MYLDEFPQIINLLGWYQSYFLSKPKIFDTACGKSQFFEPEMQRSFVRKKSWYQILKTEHVKVNKIWHWQSIGNRKNILVTYLLTYRPTKAIPSGKHGFLDLKPKVRNCL